MQEKLYDIQEAIRQIAGRPETVLTGKVISVEGETCTVELAGGLQVDQVKLKSAGGDEEGLLIIPQAGSQVTLLSHTGQPDNLTVVRMDKIDKIRLHQGVLDMEIDVTGGKYQIATSGDNLKDILNELISTLNQLKVYTPVGPSGTPLPDTVSRLQAINTRINNILK